MGTFKDKKDECSGKTITGVCANKHAGDGECDDDNNNAGCNWDGGDCCGPSKGTTFCTQCKCLDCTYKGEGSNCPKNDGACNLPNFVGDKVCDDENNNCMCNWDKGDCCGDKKNYKFCKACKCLDPVKTKKGCSGKCAVPDYKGDGNCDDDNNKCGCNWDGGDCCGKGSGSQKYCKECKCLDPEHEDSKKKTCLGSCQSPNWKGDGICDDGNNNCGCEYDKGDCCPTPEQKKNACQYFPQKENDPHRKCEDPAKLK